MSTKYPNAEQFLKQLDAEAANHAAAEAAEKERVNVEIHYKKEMAGMSQAEAIMKTCGPLYEKREKLAKELAPVLSEFWTVIADIRERENASLKALSTARQYITSQPPNEALEGIRRGLSFPDKLKVELNPPNLPGEYYSHSIIYGTYKGLLTPGKIGNITLNFKR